MSEILNADGFDYGIAVGFNNEGRKVIWVGMRLTDEDNYQPVIEIDVDLSSYWADTRTNFSAKDRKPLEKPPA